MAVRYVPYGTVRVSRRWRTVLQAADRAGIRFHVTSGHRTMAEQQALYDANMQAPGVPKPGHPLTAVPSPNAPHIRLGRAHHAIDVNSLDGGEQRLEDWLDRPGINAENTVPGEPWHLELSWRELGALARRYRRPRTQHARDLLLARKLRRNGVPRGYPMRIIEEARRERVPLDWALALIQQETGFRNVFGGDHGDLQNDFAAPFFHVPVTRERVRQLIVYVQRGHASNGVGPAQLTSLSFILLAEHEGGAHRPRINMRVGFRVLRQKSGGDFAHNAWLYNGAPTYQQQIAAKRRHWATVLAAR